MFHNRAGAGVDLDEINALTIRPLRRPAPADDPRSADDRDQAALEIRDWSRFPFEVAVETDGGMHYFFGEQAQALFVAWVAGLRPWLQA